MSSAPIAKVSCATCETKGVGIFKCEGCAQVFCRKHVIEHRDSLSHQLDEIVLEYDILQQTMGEYKDQEKLSHPLLERINKWEKESIEKIQQTATQARQQIHQLTNSHEVSKELHEFAERLRQARTDDDYVETDLRIWTTKLQTLKHDINAVSSSARICEDTTKVFIPQIYVSFPGQNLIAGEERFGKSFGDIHIEYDGCVASNNGSGRSSAYVRGKTEYFKGKHRIRFIINKRTTLFVMSFNIVPKSLGMPRNSSGDRYSSYGWHTDDCINNPENVYQDSKRFKDLHGETTHQLEVLIDCDHRKISYYNERTKNTREMDVNIDRCPFPWQLEFYLYDIGDRVQLLSSTQGF